MITNNHEAIIERPVEEVFTFIADPVNDPRWCPPVLQAEQIDGNGPAVGARYRQVVKPGPKKLTNTVALTAYQPNQSVTWKGSNGMMDFQGCYEVESLNGGASTRVFMSSNLELKGIFRLLKPFLQRASESMAEEEFQNLKQLLESGHPSPQHTK